MSNRTREINKITTTIIGISVKLMVYALIILLLYEAVGQGLLPLAMRYFLPRQWTRPPDRIW